MISVPVFANSDIDDQISAKPVDINQITNDDADACYAIASNLLEEYYIAAYSDINLDIEDSVINTGVQEYMTLSHNYKVLNRETLGIKYTDFELSVRPVEFEVKNNKLYYYIAVDARYRYEGSEEFSGFGAGSFISFSKNKGRIQVENIYTENSFDESLRGWSNFNNFKNCSETTMAISSTVISKANTMVKKATEKLQSKKEVSHNNSISPELADRKNDIDTVSSTVATSLNRTQMKVYADRNCSAANPASGSSVTTYYDFSTITGSYDCTNFISHALLAGGATMSESGNYKWYFHSLQSRSPSWSSVNSLFSFLTSNTNGSYGPYGHEYPYVEPSYYYDYPNDYSVGDLIQIKYNPSSSTWNHSTIIVGFLNLIPMIDSRTSATAYNYHELISDAYAGNEFRIIVLDGNH